jgi:RHS repeat-associated protein
VGGGWTLNRIELAQGFAATITSGEGRASQYQVEPLPTGDRRLSSIRPDGTVQTVLYKANGEQSVTGADGTVATEQQGPDPRFGMQAPLRVSSTIKTPSGLTATVTQKRTVALSDASDPFSLTSLSDTISVNGKASTLSYNAQTKTWTATSSENRTASVQINGQGRPLRSTLADIEPVAYEYDERGRLSAVSQGQGEAQRKTAYRYYDHTDAASGALKGYLQSSTDALGRSEHFTYDAAGRIVSQLLPDDRVVQYQYDANGNLTGIRPPERDDHLFNHNAVDLVERYTPPDATGIAQTYTEYFYNKDKQPTRIQRPDGQTIDFVYQPQSGKLDALRTQDGDIHYQYLSASGQLDSLTLPDGDTLNYRYDGSLATGQSWAGAINGQVDFGYNSDFRVISIGLNQADSVAYGYDKDSLITQAGQLSLTRKPQNGLLAGTALGAVSDSFGYNGFGEISDYQATVNGVPLIRWTYQRDKLGRIIQKTETSGGISHSLDYRYDDRGRLEQITDSGAIVAVYGYDANGNRTQLNGQAVAVYDSQDRLTDFNGKHYVYTDNGELQSKSENGQTTSYGYDVFGNLRHVELPDGTRIDYIVDGQNRRIGKKVNGQLVQAWLYQSQLNPIAELDGNGQVTSRFVYGDKGNVPSYLVKTDPITQAKTTYRLVSDHLGSPRLVIDAATGAVAQELDYDAWGHLVRDSNPGFQPFGFAGGLYDPHTKLVRFGARDYDAETGRWTAKDPILFAGGDTNLYGYVLNDPINCIDPFGLLNVYGYQLPSSSGWKTQYQLAFDPLSDNLQKAIPFPAWLKYTLKVIPQIDTRPVGPLHPIKDFLQCGKLDGKLKNEYQKIYDNQQRLTRDEAESFLKSMAEKYPEMNDLYPSSTDMLDQAESNSKNHWFYGLTHD